MLRLFDRSGLVVELRVAGYQFPDIDIREYDSDWLVIEGRVSHPRGGWSFRDPCLLAQEAAGLADWLEDVASDREQRSTMNFTEPNLGCEVRTAGGERILRLAFSHEARPPWPARSDDAVVEFPLAEVDLFGAVRTWRNQLRQFPQRAVR